MRWRTFMIGWTMALAVLLIAHPKPPAGGQDVGTAVVELTYANSPRTASWQHRTSHTEPGHAQKVVAPLVVMNVTKETQSDPGFVVGMDDIARWEESHGHIPANAVVMASSEAPTRWHVKANVTTSAGNAAHFPGFSEDAIRFLVEARYVYGLGTETTDGGRSVVLVYRHPSL